MGSMDGDALMPGAERGSGWWREANCHGEDLSVFFGPSGERQEDREYRELRAKALCNACPVQGQCLEDALAVNDEYGFRGGMNEDQRAKLHRRLARGKPRPSPKPPKKRRGRRVDATGPKRRLRALALIGYSPGQLAPRLRVSATNLMSIRSGERIRVSADLADRLAAVYVELIARPNPTAGWMTVSCAQGRGWDFPDAWNGLDIDDPSAQPHVLESAAA